MAKIRRAEKARAVREALAMLAALEPDGAHAVAVQADDGGQIFAVYAPGNEALQAAHASQAAVAHALRKGWVVPDASGTSLRISRAGQQVLLAERARDKERNARMPRPLPVSPRARTESALAWLRNRRDREGRPLISDLQFAAGERLATDFWYAQMSPRVTASWSAVAPGRRVRRAAPGYGVEMADAVVAARRSFQRALDAVGPELAGILVDVCCHDVGLEAAGRAAAWPERAARVVLDLALTRLARHYGLIPPEPSVGGRIRHWGDADYRPSLDAWA